LQERHISVQEMSWKNRENEKVYQCFSDIFKKEKLWVSIDRYGIMRPTKLIVNSNDEQSNESNMNTTKTTNNTNASTNNPVTETDKSDHAESNSAKTLVKEDWKTKEDWLHWDLSPFHFGTSAAGFAPVFVPHEDLSKEYGGLRVQGLITLTDCPVECGGFHCVPGFAGSRFFSWAKEHSDYGSQEDIKKRNFIEVPIDDPIRNEVTKIPMRAGSLLIWNSQLPHGNFPNKSFQFRMVQYIKMVPAEDTKDFQPVIKTVKIPEKDFFPENFAPSPLGRKLFGLDSW